MLNSTVLEVAIGLIFCFASVALITSSIFEAVASWLDLRSKNLLKGIQELLNADSPAGKELLLKIYNHAMAHPTGNGAATSTTELKSKPSYIDPRHFALTMIEAVQSVPNNFARLSSDIDVIPDQQIRLLLRSMYDRADGNIETLYTELANWYEAGMDRVSGSYKRLAQIWCFGIAFVFAALFNVDTIHLFSTLWQHPALVAQATMTSAPAHAEEAYLGLQTLPIGWQGNWMDEISPTSIIGWFITATASLFGAPFWFDLLKHLTRIRGSGPKPQSSGNPPSGTSRPVPPASQNAHVAASERNAIVELHAERNKDDESYRPVQSGERW